MYGLSFEEISKIHKPEIIKKEWGQDIRICNLPQYGLRQLIIKKGARQPFHYFLKTERTLYLEEGKAILLLIDKQGEKHRINLAPGNVFEISPGMPFSIVGIDESILYFFSKNYDENDYFIIETMEDPQNTSVEKIKESQRFKSLKTTDFREKYWGSIETIANKEFCGKKIVMKKGTQNSLEVHCNKHETYFVHSGKVKIGLRVGRAENKSIVLEKGDTFYIPPGLMHMKIAIDNCVVIEISTKDDDSDSHLVEDGQKYVHKEA